MIIVNRWSFVNFIELNFSKELMEWFTKSTVLYKLFEVGEEGDVFVSLVVGIDVQVGKRKSCSWAKIRSKPVPCNNAW